MKYIMIIIAGLSMLKIEFNSKEACLSAKSELSNKINGTIACVEKGKE